ncbi:MAG: tRNA (adenosine(37)-N6)-dimethylallyltransferase MiaA [Parcubacteria group bacterium CG10_big_fil_rev_8_21_14_0_10_36_14]|nr:MAG: tRNA (adenosine(37)-N6)-dimethylallyltransferase MiaA [Parcubacteria group bacterium CG10_big_fil_rev_8_21_14_0_10_36_14]
MKNKLQKLIVVLGPTASGKTELAIKLAKKFNGEIVNADSRAIYRDMKVGTDRPEKNEGGVRHHLVGFLLPDKDFNLAEYKQLAVGKINDILRRGKQPFLVGGTWLYISAITDNLEIPNVKPNKSWRKAQEKFQSETLYKKLQRLDLSAAERIHQNDKRRIIRALEVIHFSGQPISKQQKKGKPIFNVLKIGIKRDLDEVEKRVKKRIKIKMGDALIREIRRLLKKYSSNLPAMSSLGYPEMIKYIKGELSKEDAFFLLAKNTRRFARYQINTFRQDKNIKWVKNLQDASNKIKGFLKK